MLTYKSITQGESMLIAIEGTDGSGKQTQAELLQKELKRRYGQCELISFPNYASNSSALVKMYLNGDLGDINHLDAYQVNSLYAVDRMCSMETYKNILMNGGYLVCDRYTQSSMIYQSAQIEDKLQKDKFLNYVDNFEFNLLKIPRPDIIIFLKVPIEVSLKLMKERGTNKSGLKHDIFEDNTERLTKIYHNSIHVAQKFNWKIIECCENGQMKSKEAIHKEILNALSL